MKKKGSELEFISWIKRDGSGTKMVTNRMVESMKDDIFNLTRLSLSNQTYIASDFNSFVVKLKTK